MKQKSNVTAEILRTFFSSLSFKLPLFLVIFCAILSVVNGYIGYKEFKELFEEHYAAITTQVARTALNMIDVDRLEYYAEHGAQSEDDAWRESDKSLDNLTLSAELAFIYVTVPDTKEYKYRTYVYDTVHPDVENGKKYPLGKVSSLEKYNEAYINNIKKVMIHGEPYCSFVYNSTGGHVTTSVPAINSEGRIVGMCSVVKPMNEVEQLRKQFLNSMTISSTVMTLVFVLFFVLILIFKVVRPLAIVTRETYSFARKGAHLSTHKLQKIKGRNEIAILARAVEQMNEDMQNYITELTRVTAEEERLTAELDVATQIQANMLPRIFPPYENHPEIELFASMKPAKEVGGDFYDFFMIDEDHFAVVVGDVSGKGVPAALFMVIAKTLIKNECLQGFSPAKVFDIVNDQLCEGNDAGLFVTCWLGILTISTGELRFVNAGHTSPLMFHKQEISYLVTKPNLMLAGMQGIKYTEHTIVLDPGDHLFVYTDGITEATNSSNELYGEERLLNAIKNVQNIHTPKELLEAVNKDIELFVDGAPQFDDITMLELLLKKK